MLDSLQGPFDAGTKFLFDKNGGKLAQFKIGREVIAAIPWGIDGFDRAQASQELQPWLAAPKLMSSRFMISSMERALRKRKEARRSRRLIFVSQLFSGN